MCRLLGIRANKEVYFDFSLSKFKKYGDSNPDGWGLGWYESKIPNIFKQPIATTDKDSSYDEYKKQVKSDIIITHVRLGTHGSNSLENTHPFNYENYIFAHNGVADREGLLKKLEQKYKNLIKGKTDSEVYFYYILQSIEEKGDIISGLKYALRDISKSNGGGLNFLLSDGKNLYAFRYSLYSQSYYTLFYLKRNFEPYTELEYLSKETQLLLKSKDANLEKAVLFCSEKLTEENWESIRNGQLVVIDEMLNIIKYEIV